MAKGKKRGRKLTYTFEGEKGITKREFTRIDNLSKRAVKKYNNIINKYKQRDPNKERLIDLDRYSFRFGGDDEHYRDFKSVQGVRNYTKSLEKFLRPEWEQLQFERYKQNFIDALITIYGNHPHISYLKNLVDLRNEIDKIESLDELMYVYNETNGDINISFIYLRSKEQLKKTIVDTYHKLRDARRKYRQ